MTVSPLAFRQKIGRIVEAMNHQAGRIDDEQKPRSADAGGMTKPDPDELARAAALREGVRLLNDLVPLDQQLGGLAAAWTRLQEGR